MKRATTILVTVAVLIASAVFACNSGKGQSTNNEGLVAATAPQEAIPHGAPTIRVTKNNNHEGTAKHP